MILKPEFFKEEIRNGFCIEPMMKCAWAVQMDILEDVQRLCKNNGIRYFADSGTLLGTIRHGGYIPWDDDIDIAMLRTDYDRFLEIIKREWKDKYVLQIPGITDNYSETFIKILNSDKISFATEDLRKFHGCPYITGIDIFPLDTIPDNEGERDVLIELYRILNNTIHKVKDNSEEIMGVLQKIEELYQYRIDRSGDIAKQLCGLADLVSKSYNGTDNTTLAIMSYNNILLRKEWYDEEEWRPFETLILPVPKKYHEVLTAWYGDYMTPVQGKSTHDYPFYKKQMTIIEKKVAKKVYGVDISNIKKEY